MWAEYNRNVQDLTTMGVGGKVECYVLPKNLEDLMSILQFAKSRKIKINIMGNGSNIILKDNVEGFLIDLRQICHLRYSLIQGLRYRDKGQNVYCPAFILLYELLSRAYVDGLTGLESLIGIPATVGGAVFMNAGIPGYNISDHIVRIEVLSLHDFKIYTLDRKELDFGYRNLKVNSDLPVEDFIITAVIFNLEFADQEDIEEKQSYYFQKRVNQPVGKSSGCIFRNPYNNNAGRLIEAVGLKGHTIGGAQISEHHANWIINKDNATYRDIIDLIELAEQKVREEFNIQLEREVKVVG